LFQMNPVHTTPVYQINWTRIEKLWRCTSATDLNEKPFCWRISMTKQNWAGKKCLQTFGRKWAYAEKLCCKWLHDLIFHDYVKQNATVSNGKSKR
jgi:hypothetical protein